MNTWHSRLKQRREELGLTQREFARRVGVSGATVSEWESGKIKKIDADNMDKAARVLETTADYLLRGAGPMRAGALEGHARAVVTATGALTAAPPDPLDTLPPDERVLLLLYRGLTRTQQEQFRQSVEGAERANRELMEELLERKKRE
jgi:transcriptional regulator with XRE-family HTH domain